VGESVKLAEQVMEAVADGVRGDPKWARLWSELWGGAEKAPTLHLAIFVEPYLTYILEGRKTIESRFSSRRTAPFGRVAPDDVLMLKVSGGPVVGLCRVRKVWFYELDPHSWQEIRDRFAEPLCATDNSFWAERKSAEYATLLQVGDIRSIPPLEIPKRDRRGWVVLEKHTGRPSH
jgi:hypothetical protein